MYSLVINAVNPKQFKLYLIVILSISFIPATFAQRDILQKKITIQRNQIKLSEAIAAVENAAGCSIAYSETFIDANKIVSLNATNVPLSEVMQQLFGELARGMQVRGNQINIQPSKGKGEVSGTVITSDGEPGGFVTVSIRGQHSTQADEQGRFTLKNIEARTHTITASYVGLQTQRQTIAVVPGGSVNVIFTLSEDAQTLQEVIVNGERVNKFAGKQTEYVARMPLSNLENPQVYSTVTKEIMAEQLAIDITDALANTPGVVSNAFPAGNFGVTLRGFNTYVNARNGMQTSLERSSVDLVNMERIEVLKGPSGTLFQGQGSYGGVVNLVTKKPHKLKAGSVGYSFGSYGLSRTTVDFNTPVNRDSTLLFRVNTSLHRIGSFKDAGHKHTFTVAPSITYRVNDRLTLSGDLEYYNFDETRPGSFSFGPYRSATDMPLQKTALVGNDVNAEGANLNAFFNATYRLSPGWVLTTNLASINLDLKSSYQPYYSFNSNGDSLKREVALYGPISIRQLHLQQNANGEFRIGSMKNRLLLGVDFSNYDYTANRAFRHPIDTISIHNPFALTRGNIQQVYAMYDRPTGIIHRSSYRFAAYASDVLNITDRLLTMVSLRVDRYEDRFGDPWGQTAFSPKLGIVYQPIKDRIALFANFLDGFTNLNTAQKEDGSIVSLNPEHAIQYEGGAKFDLFDKRLNVTASYYYIWIENATLTDDQGWFLTQDGEQVSRGVDVELLANPIAGLNIAAGYAHNENKYTRAPVFEGKYAIEVPRNVGNFWVSYKFQPVSALRNVGLAIGGNIVGDIFLSGDNTTTSPSYSLFDASIFYELPKWRIGLKGNNLTDASYYSFGGIRQNPRHMVANLTYLF